MEFLVGKDGDGVLLRTYLKRLRLSSALVSHLKALPDGITVNGIWVTVRYVLSAGDRIGIAVEDTASSPAVVPVELPFSVLYEDDDTVVCNKPPYMPTHPSHNHSNDTLANALAYYYRDRPFVFRPVNRLDRNTGGAVLVAKNARAASMLFTEMMNRRIEKTYLAVLCGELCGSGTVEKPLRRTAQSIIVREVCNDGDEGAQYAKTDYTALSHGNGLTVVRLVPHTGRTHQLRVHMAYLGHPICGDDLYGEKSALIDRQALHACILSFARPSDCSRVTVEAPLHDDISRLSALAGYDGL